MTLLLCADINRHMALPRQTFLAKNVDKEVCFPFILAESMLKNTTPTSLGICSSNKKYAVVSAMAIFNCAHAIGFKQMNVF